MVQEKLARDKNHDSVRSIYKELVDECLNRPPSAEDANSIAGRLSLHSGALWQSSTTAVHEADLACQRFICDAWHERVWV